MCEDRDRPKRSSKRSVENAPHFERPSRSGHCFPHALRHLCRRLRSEPIQMPEHRRRRQLPEPLNGLGEISGDRWSFALIPGWRRLSEAPLEEICARQYIACNEAVLEARESIDPSRWHELAYEDLVASPVETVRELYERLGLAFDPAVEGFAAGLDRRPSSTTLSQPQPGKWRRMNREAIERILPLTEPIEKRLGY